MATTRALALAWTLSFTQWSEARRLRVVRMAAVGYGLLAGVVIVANLASVGVLRLPPGAIIVAASGALALLAAGAQAIRGLLGPPALQKAPASLMSCGDRSGKRVFQWS